MAALDRRLNIVDTITTSDGRKLHVHSTPIRREIFDQHYLVLAKLISQLYAQDISPLIGQRIALRMVRDLADELGRKADVDTNLLPEIWRLTNVLVPDPAGGGYQTLPFERAISDGLIGEDDADVVRNLLCFFTAASWVHSQKELKEMIYPMLRTSGSQTVSSTLTDYRASLPTSTPAEPTGANGTATPSATAASTG